MSLVDTIGKAAGDAVHSAQHLFDGAPLGPPPLPVQPPPVEPPPLDPPYPPLIVCPPAAPPPEAPPSFNVWSAHVPGWFWALFVMIVFTSVAGFAAIVYILRELRMQRLGRQRLSGEDTMRALEMLSGRIARGNKRDPAMPVT